MFVKIIINFIVVTIGRPLFHLGSHLLYNHDLIRSMNLDIMKVMKFLGMELRDFFFFFFFVRCNFFKVQFFVM